MTQLNNNNEVLFLLDGHALAYRAYYAFIRNPLVNSKGDNTSAAFGFTRVLMTLIKKYSPRYMAVVFDSPEQTQRHIDFPEYKAQREEMPDDMEKQLPWIFEIVEAFGIKLIVEPGFEADDIIATLAREAERKGIDVKIVTGDKDFLQLLSEKIHIIKPSRGTAFEEEIGPEYTEKRYGLKCNQIIDLLALMGDSSDNIPGVKGIGEKTAIKLLAEFGSLEDIYGAIENVQPESLKKKLIEGKDDAFLSYDLVKLKELPLEISIDNLRRGDIDESKMVELFIALDFHQFLKELSLKSLNGGRVDYSIVTRLELDNLRSYLGSVDEFVVDVETTSLDPMRAEIVGVSFCAEKARSFYVPIISAKGSGLFSEENDSPFTTLDEFRQVIGPVLTDSSIGKIGHNIKYDLVVLECNGVRVDGVSFDTMIASYCLDPERFSHSLDNLSIEFLHHRMISYDELFQKGDRIKDIRAVGYERMRDYSCEDADITFRLKELFDEELDRAGLRKLFYDVEMPLCVVLKKMEMNGVSIDRQKLAQLSRRVTEQLEELKGKIYTEAGEEFNINSNKQLQRILFEKLSLPSGRKTKTGYSTDSEVLSRLSEEHEIARLILEYRQLAKFKSTYIDAIPRLINPKTGKVHATFNQTVTSTGRLSSSDPNLQNIPIRSELGREIRRAFIPSSGHVILDADYSQIELRIMAHLSKDPELVRAFDEGVDVHTRTASRIYRIPESEVDSNKRDTAKTINFGVIYGMGPRGLARQLGIKVEEAREFIEEYFKRYPGVKEFVEKARIVARERGYAETIMGRRRFLPEINSEDNRLRSMSERVAVNMPVQGSAADMIKVAMIRIDREIEKRGFKGKMIIQVHDELVFDVPRDEVEEFSKMVKEQMESAITLDVPVKVEIGIGTNWLEAHS